uniref:Ubiquitin-like protease family profile domain-containing protein n=1 Tax=Lactuca sativa TaxID=4236 RepID=A0A9R1UHN5_LACSA|nr:hypothetical protein LSAT_V11C900500300 [Lactuca sativa]
MKITDIPLKLGFYVLQKFDSERMVIDIEGKELKVTSESVHDMLGIPIGGTKLTQLDQWPKDDTSYDEWKQQFKKDSIIRPSAIKNVIISTTQVDFNFKLNFLVLFVNTFCESTSMGRCNLFPLSYISRKTDISNIDWCNYVLDCLVRTKNSYIPYSDNSFFLFYADNIYSEALTVARKLPTICYWSSEKIRYRETFEQEKGRFGVGELNEEFVNEQNEGDTDLEDNDSDKDEDHSVEAYESEISKMINNFERMKEKLNSKLNDATTKFPEKEKNEDKEGNGEEDSDNGASQPEVDYLLNSNEADNEGIKNDADKNKKEGEIRVKEKDAKRNENPNDEEEKDDHAEEKNNYEETIQQTENQNLLDKVVNNIVDNVLGIGVSSLNSQEDEIWNHPEMKTIVDNIDIGSPMSTCKTNTLVEKEKSEGVHEQGTKVEKTKGDDTGKENSEDRNEGGTEAKNTKDGSGEKQTKIEKGNAEDRGKKKSENQNKKGEKADKTKGNKGDTHPSFSLGLSQDSDQTSSKKSNESSPKKALIKKQIKDDHQKVVIRLAKKNVPNPNPISVSIPTEVGPSKHDLDQPREKKLADAFKSPFKCRITDTKPKRTHQESIVCEWLFNLQGNTSDVVVQTKYCQIAERAVMESLYASTEIFGEVLDTWSNLLNHQELERDFGNSPYRLFLKVGVSTAYLTSTLSDERKYEKFKENFHDGTNGYKKISNIKDIDMVFFPVVRSAHIFVTVFNLKKPSIEILDNSAVEGDYEGKYGVIMKPLAKVLDLAEKYQKVEFKVRTDHAYKAMQTIQKRLKEY